MFNLILVLIIFPAGGAVNFLSEASLSFLSLAEMSSAYPGELSTTLTVDSDETVAEKPVTPIESGKYIPPHRVFTLKSFTMRALSCFHECV